KDTPVVDDATSADPTSTPGGEILLITRGVPDHLRGTRGRPVDTPPRADTATAGTQCPLDPVAHGPSHGCRAVAVAHHRDLGQRVEGAGGGVVLAVLVATWHDHQWHIAAGRVGDRRLPRTGHHYIR